MITDVLFAPPSNLYRLSRDHVAAEGIQTLARMWATLVARIRAELETWSVPPQAAWLFGSAVRGEATEQSDIDIFLVLPTDGSEAIVSVWDRQTNVLTEKITAWSGNPCEVTEMDAAELRAAVERDDRLIRDLREHAVALAGSDPRASCAERSWDDCLLVRLLGRHRHQDVTPIDREIACDADGNAENADGILDHLECLTSGGSPGLRRMLSSVNSSRSPEQPGPPAR